MAFDILILSNGPGELATWVRPVVHALRQLSGNDRAFLRISVILSPCPHATGKETAIGLSYPEVDRVQSPEHFFPFLLWGKTAENWDWRDKGVVLFLGGDQFFTIVIGKRLNYRTVIYAEWDARWHKWCDRFAIMQPNILTKVPPKYAHKFTIVGDLIADIIKLEGRGDKAEKNIELIGLLPGSKPAKLAQGMPLCLAIAHHLHSQRSQTEFIIPVAPTLDLETLAKFADIQQNPLIAKLGGISAKLHLTNKSEKTGFLSLENTEKSSKDEETRFLSNYALLETNTGLKIRLITENPAYDILSQCQICLTTVGANTAELGSLAVPMIVLLPTQQFDAMRAWDGIPGILANLPLFGSLFARLINWLVWRQGKLFAWPNIWAKKEIVPELVGNLEPEKVAQLVIDYLSHPEKLEEMRVGLRAVRGKPGAAKKIAQIITEEMN
jgi:lipid A disaccharide synthetase